MNIDNNCNQDIKECQLQGSDPQKTKTEKSMPDALCEHCVETAELSSSSVKKESFFKKHKITIIALSILFIVGVISFFGVKFGLPYYYYSKAQTLIDSGDYARAYYHLKKCIDYKDSGEILDNFKVIYEKKYENDLKEGREYYYTYSENGDLIERIEYKNGVKISESKYGNDDSHDLIYKIGYDENGNFEYKYESVYDNKGTHLYALGALDADGYDDAPVKADTEYDADGNPVKVNLYKANRVLGYVMKFKYDDGNLILKTTYDADGNVTAVNEYDKDGNHIMNKTKFGKAISVFDENGNKVSKKEYDQNDNKLYEEIREYDEKGNQISAITYDGEGNLQSKEVTEYDENGNEILVLKYDDWDITEKRVTEYSETGKSVTKYNRYGRTIGYVEYDKHGNALRNVVYNIFDDFDHESVYEYDDMGNVIRETQYDKNGDVNNEYIYVYEYNDYEDIVYESKCDENGEYEYKNSYKYKYDHGIIIAETHYDMNEEVISKYEYTNPIVTYNPEEDK